MDHLDNLIARIKLIRFLNYGEKLQYGICSYN